jgi:hypothetical protein
MIHIKYKIWFALRLEVEDYPGDALELLNLEPTERCIRNLERSRLIVKRQPGMLTHLIEVHADGPDTDKPVYTPIDTLVYRYRLSSRGGGMEQRSNISSLDPAQYTLFLSNDSGNSDGGRLNMHRSGAFSAAGDRLYKGSFEETEGTLAIADVYQNNLVPAGFRLRDAAGHCREPVFVMRFARHP